MNISHALVKRNPFFFWARAGSPLTAAVPKNKIPYLTRCARVYKIVLDRIEKKFGGERFNNPDNAEKNKALNANILKRVKQVMGMVV